MSVRVLLCPHCDEANDVLDEELDIIACERCLRSLRVKPPRDEPGVVLVWDDDNLHVKPSPDGQSVQLVYDDNNQGPDGGPKGAA